MDSISEEANKIDNSQNFDPIDIHISSEELPDIILEDQPEENDSVDANPGYIVINVPNRDTLPDSNITYTDGVFETEAKKEEELKSLLKTWELRELEDYFVGKNPIYYTIHIIIVLHIY